MKIAVLSLWTKEIDKYAKPVNEVRKKYCEKHGYTLITADTSLDNTRHPAWSKIKLIQQAILDYEYVFWNDADCVITDNETAIETFIDSNYIFQVAYDGDKHWRHSSTKYISPGINTGNILIKGGELAHQWLDKIYNWEGNAPWYYTPCWEQSGFEQVYVQYPEFQELVKIMKPFDLWNGENGSFLKHALGLHQTVEAKLSVLEKYLQ